MEAGQGKSKENRFRDTIKKKNYGERSERRIPRSGKKGGQTHVDLVGKGLKSGERQPKDVNSNKPDPTSKNEEGLSSIH